MSPLIEFENVTIVRGERVVLNDVSLQIADGEHVAIIGPNGCGKSTFIRALARELYPFGGIGAVKVGGRDRWRISELRTVLGMVSEEPKSPLLGDPTGLEMAVSGLIGTYGVVAQHEVTSTDFARATRALEQAGAKHLANQTIETMSTGERRRVFIARALVSQPRGLVLDEPTSGLDMKAASDFHKTMSQIASVGTTLILVTHHLEEIVPEILRVIMIKNGRLIEDGPRDQVLRPEKISSLFDFEFPPPLPFLPGRLRPLS